MGVKKKHEVCAYCSGPLGADGWSTVVSAGKSMHSVCALFDRERIAKEAATQHRLYNRLLDRALDES